MKIVAWADAHMWPLTWKRFPQVREDSELAARQVFTYARDNGLPVVFAGDLFDHGESGEVSRELMLFDRYRHNHPTYFVVGNHEDAGWFTAGQPNEAWLSVLVAQDNGLHHLEGEPKRIGELVVGGLDYCRGADLAVALEQYRQRLTESGTVLDVFVCHQALKELLSFDGAYHATCEQLVGIAPIVIVGDVHIPRVWEVGGTTFVSPGSTAINNWDEIEFKDGRSTSGRRGFFVLDIEKTGDGTKLVGHERVLISQQRTFFDLNALTPEGEANTLKTLREYAGEQLPPPPLDAAVARVRYDAGSRSFRAELDTLLETGKFVLDPMPVVRALEAPKELQALVPADGQEVSIRSVVERHVDVQADPQLASLLVELLEDPAGRPDKILDRVVAEIIGGVCQGDESGEERGEEQVS